MAVYSQYILALSFQKFCQLFAERRRVRDIWKNVLGVRYKAAHKKHQVGPLLSLLLPLCVCVCARTRTHAHTHTHNTHALLLLLQTHTKTCTCVCVYLHVCVCVCMCVCVYQELVKRGLVPRERARVQQPSAGPGVAHPAVWGQVRHVVSYLFTCCRICVFVCVR